MTTSLRFSPDDVRVRRLNDRPEIASREFVLYWSQAYRRASDNAALGYAIARADALGLPVLFYEGVRPDYPHASDRFHTFLLECARDNAIACETRGIAHALIVPRTPDDARGVVAKLASRAALVVSDDFPGFIAPAQNAAAAKRVDCAFVVVDDAAGVPMALFPKLEYAARTLRPKLAKVRDAWIAPLDDPDPKTRAKKIALPFDAVDLARADVAKIAAACAIDHAVRPVAETPGGSSAALARLAQFVKKLPAYLIDRNDPSRDGASGLSPYLHFGAISARRVALTVMHAAEDRGAPESGDALLEQLLVRRGLAYNFARHEPRHMTYAAMPAWARETLALHAKDAREVELDLEALEDARSPDPLWNAAQLELRARGTIQNYARMLWGKLVIPWTRDPARAHAMLVTMNDRYALDGRDPDGWANIGWCFGLHDRPWPERKYFGTVRTMTSRSAQTKLDFESYISASRAWRSATT